MAVVDLAQRYASLAVLVACDETPVLLLGSQLLALLLEACVKLRQLRPEILDTAVEQLLRNEKVGLYIALLN